MEDCCDNLPVAAQPVKSCLPMKADLNAVAVFVVLAETLSFRAAADWLGVTCSAISQGARNRQPLRSASHTWNVGRWPCLTVTCPCARAAPQMVHQRVQLGREVATAREVKREAGEARGRGSKPG